MTSDTKLDRGRRLKKAREAAGYQTAAAFARALNVGIDDYTYRTYESGSRSISPDYADKFSMALGISLEWLLTGKTEYGGILSSPIRGKIIDGGFITATHFLTGGETMEGAGNSGAGDACPPEDFAFFALAVETKQFEPHTNEGSVIYYSRTPQNPVECIGSQCVIQIKGSKPVFATLLRGSRLGVYDIQGHGSDLEIDWCARREFTRHA